MADVSCFWVLLLCSALDSIMDPVSRCYMVTCAEYCVMATLAVAVHWSSVILLSCWIMLDA